MLRICIHEFRRSGSVHRAMTRKLTSRVTENPSVFAMRFFAMTAGVFCTAGLLAQMLIHFARPAFPSPGNGGFPHAFWLSTLLLFAGSVMLQGAVFAVRRERQPQFRRLLILSLVSATLFVGVQIFGLWCLWQIQRPAEASTGATACVFVFAAVHGLHFSIAILFLVFVTLQAFADRYDHEYYFGVTVCAYFWHFLGTAWMAIFAVLGISSLPLF